MKNKTTPPPKPAETKFMFWSGGYGMYGGATEAEAVAQAREWERMNHVRCRVTEHDTSVHAIGHKTDETLVREITFTHYDHERRS